MLKSNQTNQPIKKDIFHAKLIFTRDKILFDNAKKSGFKKISFSFLAIFFSLIISLLIVVIVYRNGNLFPQIIKQIFTYPFLSSTWKNTISWICIFAIAGLAFVFSQKVGLFNIGLSGQMLFGAQMAILIAWLMPHVPTGLGQILVILISMVGGACIALIITCLKIKFNINEVISSIMLNWIVYLIGTWLLSYVGSKMGTVGDLNTNPLESNLHINISGSENSIWSGTWIPFLIIMLIMLTFSIVVLNYSTFGKKTTCIGLNNTAAIYAGINMKTQQIFVMMISGAFAGLFGAMIYCGIINQIPITISDKTIPTYGFTGISIGLISTINPWGVAPVSCLFAMVDVAKAGMQQQLNIQPTITDLLFGIIVYGSATISIFYLFKPWIWFLNWKNNKNNYTNYLNYNTSREKTINETKELIHTLKNTHKNLLLIKKNNTKLNSMNADLIVKYDEQNINQINGYINDYYAIVKLYLTHDQIYTESFDKSFLANVAKLNDKYNLDGNAIKFVKKYTKLINKLSNLYFVQNDNYILINSRINKCVFNFNELIDKNYLKECINTIMVLYSLNVATFKTKFKYQLLITKDSCKSKPYYQKLNEINVATNSDLTLIVDEMFNEFYYAIDTHSHNFFKNTQIINIEKIKYNEQLYKTIEQIHNSYSKKINNIKNNIINNFNKQINDLTCEKETKIEHLDSEYKDMITNNNLSNLIQHEFDTKKNDINTLFNSNIKQIEEYTKFLNSINKFIEYNRKYSFNLYISFWAYYACERNLNNFIQQQKKGCAQ